LIYRIKYRAVYARGKLDAAENLIVLPLTNSTLPKSSSPSVTISLLDSGRKSAGVRLAESGDAVDALTFEVEDLHGL